MTKSRGLRDGNSRKEAIASGAKRYMSSAPCKNGHISERLTSNGSCLACIEKIKSEKDRVQYEKNAEKIKARSSKWRDENKERAKENDKRKWFANHEENLKKCKIRSKRYTERRRLDREYEAFMEGMDGGSC